MFFIGLGVFIVVVSLWYMERKLNEMTKQNERIIELLEEIRDKN